MDFDNFDWDDGNREKCRKHGVSLEEIEFVICRTTSVSADPAHSISEQRFIAVGANSDGRMLFVALTFRQRDELTLIRPVSARYMHAKEASRYVQEDRD